MGWFIREGVVSFSFLLYFMIIFKLLPWRPLIRQRPSCRLCWLSLYYRAASAPVRCLCASLGTGTLSVDWAPFPCHTMFIPSNPTDEHRLPRPVRWAGWRSRASLEHRQGRQQRTSLPCHPRPRRPSPSRAGGGDGWGDHRRRTGGTVTPWQVAQDP